MRNQSHRIKIEIQLLLSLKESVDVMTKNVTLAKRPGYMLKSGSEPIFPKVVFDAATQVGVCIYGFSGKPIYDDFIRSAAQLLTPYPLVMRFLAEKIASLDTVSSSEIGPALVILDATSATQPVVVAATMATVLQAMEDNVKQVPVEFELVFDGEKGSYQLAANCS